MAENTDIRLQNQVIYSIYVRNHTEEGSFSALVPDLDRIKALGTDIIWLLPIHPIGLAHRKGSLGCPYANRDYRSVNPDYGSMEDFRALVEEIHSRGMKCMIDVVYNHTSPDSTLFQQHPDFFYRSADGRPGNKIGDWWDVIDLDYGNAALWDYQIESLVMWAGIVDGFRCDVASFVPAEFWRRAREAVSRVRPGCIWLAETVHRSFGCAARRQGIYSALDYELYSAFDIEYEYDIREAFDGYMKGELPLSHWLDLMNFQEAAYPANYNKLRFLENHDQPRICSAVAPGTALESYTAMLYFLKGTTLIYAGQEFENSHVPSLFEKDVIDRSGGETLSALMRRLYDIKSGLFGAEDYFIASGSDPLDTAVLERGSGGRRFFGIFSLRGKCGRVSVSAPDGEYENLIDGSRVTVKDGQTASIAKPIIFMVKDIG